MGKSRQPFFIAPSPRSSAPNSKFDIFTSLPAWCSDSYYSTLIILAARYPFIDTYPSVELSFPTDTALHVPPSLPHTAPNQVPQPSICSCLKASSRPSKLQGRHSLRFIYSITPGSPTTGSVLIVPWSWT